MKNRKSSFSILNRMTLRSLKHGWAQYLAIIAIGAIAVTLFVGLLANADSFEDRVNTAYDAGNLADIWVTTTSCDSEDEKAIEEIIEGEGNVEGRFYTSATVSNSSVYLSVTEKMPTISTIYGESYIDPSYEEFLYLDKELMKTDTSSMAETYSIGDVISISLDISSYVKDYDLSLLDDYVLKGKTNVFTQEKVTFHSTVTGFVSNPENITKSTYNSSLVMMSDRVFRKAFDTLIDENFQPIVKPVLYQVLQDSLGFKDYYTSSGLSNPNQYLITLYDEDKASEFKEKIQDYFNSKEKSNLYLITQRKDMPFCVTLENDVKQARQFTFVFPFVFFAVAILVILTTLSQMVLKERSQIGTMKAIGLTKRDIYWHYILMTLILVGIGTLLGEIIGPIIVPNILGQKYSLLYSIPKWTYTFPTLYGILTAVAFLFLSALVTFLICRKEVSLKPVESMRPVQPKLKNIVRNDKEKKQSVFVLSIKMALRNIRLNKAKSLMVFIGVIGCTALLVCGFGIEDTVNHGIDHAIEYYHNADITVTFDTSKDDEQAKSAFQDIEGVEFIEPTLHTVSNMYLEDGPQMNSNLYIVQEENSHLKYKFSKDKVIISQKVSRSTGAKAGDIIHFQYNNTPLEAEVEYVYEGFVYHGIFIHSDASILESFGKIRYMSASIDIAEGASLVDVKNRILESEEATEAVTVEEYQLQINDVLSSVLIMTNAVKVFAILLAIVVLYNLALMNFRERTRDIATLKVLGFTRKEISLSLMVESLSLTAGGVILGMISGYPFMLAVLMTNIVDLVEYLYFIAPLSYFLGFLLSFVVAFVVNLYLMMKIKKVMMVESLKSIE